MSPHRVGRTRSRVRLQRHHEEPARLHGQRRARHLERGLLPIRHVQLRSAPVTQRPKANAGYAELLASSVVWMMQEQEYTRPGVELCAQPSPRVGVLKPNQAPGSPILGALDIRGAPDPVKRGGTPDPRPNTEGTPPAVNGGKQLSVSREWAPVATPAAAESAEPEYEPVCTVQPTPAGARVAAAERAVDSANLKVVPDPNQAVGKPETQVRDIDLPDAAPALHGRIQTMLATHEEVWPGEPVGAIQITKHRMELNTGALPVRAAVRRTRPRTTKAEVAGVKRMLEAVFIELTSS